jgi:BlaI family penicillinase repressor
MYYECRSCVEINLRRNRKPFNASECHTPEGGCPLNLSRLTRYELELMDVLWSRNEGTVQDVCDGLQRPLAYTTVMTTLSLLERKKGVLQRVKQGRAYVYRPTVTREEVSLSVLSDLRDVLFGGRLPSLVLNMLSEDELSSEDVVAVREALAKLEQHQ